VGKLFKWAGIVFFATLLVAGAILLRTLVFTGQFTQLSPHFSEPCRTATDVTGAEDLDIDPDTGTLFISAYDRRAGLAGAGNSGALYRLDLADPDAGPIPLWRGESPGDFRPHGLSLYRSGDGKKRLFVINHPASGQHLVEVFDLADGWLTHVESISDPLFVSPNDLVATGMRAFYIGNDVMSQNPIMKLLETMLPLAPSTLVYFDGQKAAIAAADLSFVNGVALSNSGRELYLAETTGKNVRIYDRNTMTGALALRETISLNSFPDNITVDADDALWIGSHPRLTDFLRHASDANIMAPSQLFRIKPIRNAKSRVEEVYLNDGTQISAVSTALRHGKHLAMGAVFDSKLLVCNAPRSGVPAD